MEIMDITHDNILARIVNYGCKIMQKGLWLWMACDIGANRLAVSVHEIMDFGHERLRLRHEKFAC